VDWVAACYRIAAEHSGRAGFPAVVGIHVGFGIQPLCRVEVPNLVARAENAPQSMALHRILACLAGNGSRAFP